MTKKTKTVKKSAKKTAKKTTVKKPAKKTVAKKAARKVTKKVNTVAPSQPATSAVVNDGVVTVQVNEPVAKVG